MPSQSESTVEHAAWRKNKKQFRGLFNVTDFSLPIEAWEGTGEVMGSILVASLVVNLVSLAFPLTLLQIYDRIIPNVAYNTLVLLVIGVVVALIIETLMRIVRAYVGAWADSKFEHLIGVRAFKHLLKSELIEYIQEGAGFHLKRINAINQMRDFYAGQALVSIADVPFVFLLLGLVALIAGWLVLVPTFILTLFILKTISHARHLDAMLQSRKAHDDRRSNFLVETLTNIHTVKSITMEAQMMRRYERLEHTSALSDYDLSMMGAKAMGYSTALSQMTIILVVTFGSIMVMHGQLTIGGLAACTLLSGRSLQPINSLISVWTRLQTIKLARDELQEVLDLPYEGAPDAPSFKVEKGDIFFRDVSFRYSKETPLILDHFNLVVRSKEAISISGEGLSGRSTICWMLLGMLKPDSGQVLVDGRDIFQYDLQSLRRQIGYLPQQGALFNGTIFQNLSMFREGEVYFKKAVAAAKLVGLNDIIERFQDGYDTMVADQSIEALPRGLRQRIAIARALVDEPPIIIFDEANTSIDMKGDEDIKLLLQRLIGRVTLIVISHRPSILKLLPKNYILEHGQLRLKHE